MPTKTSASTTGAQRRITEQNTVFYEFAYRLLDWVTSHWSGQIVGYGRENVRPDHGFFLIGNHTSAIDPFAVTIALRGTVVAGPGKRELFRHPLVGFLLRKLGIFPLERDGLDAGAVRTMVRLYRTGRIVEVYPEGGRRPGVDLAEFDPGLTRLLLKLDAPIVPFGIAGASEMLPLGATIPRRHAPIVVVFGPEFDLATFAGRHPDAATIHAATEELRRHVAAAVSEAQHRLRAAPQG